MRVPKRRNKGWKDDFPDRQPILPAAAGNWPNGADHGASGNTENAGDASGANPIPGDPGSGGPEIGQRHQGIRTRGDAFDGKEALSEAMDKADAKGAKESLMLYKDIAFIASIRNRTLITAVDPRDSKENVFTNIDSAVIVK